FSPVMLLTYKHSLPLNFPHLHLPRNICSNPKPLLSPIFSFAFAAVLPVAKCSLSGVLSSSIAKANTLSIVLPALTAPSAMFIVLFLHFFIYSLCLLPNPQLIVCFFLIVVNVITVYFFVDVR